MTDESSLSNPERGPMFGPGAGIAFAFGGVVVTMLTASLLSVLVYRRYQLPYNSEGRYFDPASAVVHEQQGLEVLFIGAACAWLVTLALGRLCWRLYRERYPS